MQQRPLTFNSDRSVAIIGGPTQSAGATPAIFQPATLQADRSVFPSMDTQEEIPTRGFTGVWIPRHVWEHPDINCTERCLFGEIQSLSWKTGWCFASNEHLGKGVGVAADRIGRMVSHLKAIGLVEIGSFNGRSRLIRAVSDMAKVPGLLRRKSRSRHGEKTDHSIIDSNVVSKEGERQPSAPHPLSEEDQLLEAAAAEAAAEDTQPAAPLPPEATFWNNNCGQLSKAVAFSNSRFSKLRLRRKDKFWSANFETAVVKVAASDFCNGKTDRGWRATFDWMLQPDVVAKVIEGKYDNRTNAPAVRNMDGNERREIIKSKNL